MAIGAALAARLAAAIGSAAATWLLVDAGRIVQVGTLDRPALRDALRHTLAGHSHRQVLGRPTLDGDLRRGVLRLDPLQPNATLACAWPRACALMQLEANAPNDDSEWIHRTWAGFYRLTPGECRVLALLAEGLRNADIATHLHISPLPVQTHLRSLRTKTGRRSQLDLLRLALGR